MTYSHISNSHLPRLSTKHLEQMATFASNHPQEQMVKSRFFAASLLDKTTEFLSWRKPVFAGAGLAMASIACIALFMALPAMPPQQSSAPEITYYEDTISEYIIQDFLDEIV